jgi:hypothetical protein
MLIHTVNVIE